MMIGIGAVELIVLFVLILGLTILWFWSIIDVVKSNFKDSNYKVIWIIIIVFVPAFGSILYLIIGRKQKV